VFSQFIGEKRKVLIIGDDMGYDYFYLKDRGKDVTVLDISKQYHIRDFVLGDVTQGIGFPDKTFDTVTMGEVLEHLFEDVFALQEVRRVLKDDGKLVLSVPFLSDKSEFHVRVHSPRTIRRLLSYSGFRIVDYIERGGLVTFGSLVHKIESFILKVVKLVYLALGKDKRGSEDFDMGFRGAINSRLSKVVVPIDIAMGRRRLWILKMSRYYGCFILAEKTEVRFDPRQENIEAFQRGLRQFSPE